MTAAGSIQGNAVLAEGANLGGGSSGGFRLLTDIHQRVDPLDDQEKNKSGNNKGRNRSQEVCAGGADVFPGIEIPIPGEDSIEKGLDKVCGQSRNDGGKGAADDNADCHIQNVTAKGKFLKFL